MHLRYSETGPSQAELLRQLEQRLLEPELRRSPQDLAHLLADELIEFGSSRRIYGKQQVIEALQHEPVRQISLTEFAATLLTPGVMLTTYRIVEQSARKEYATYSLHSSIWKFMGNRWQMAFHQGTPSQEHVQGGIAQPVPPQ